MFLLFSDQLFPKAKNPLAPKLKMPEITVNIKKGASQISNKATEITPTSLGSLLSGLKSAKEETNSILTKLVEESKEPKQTRKASEDDSDEAEEESEDDESAKKKQKS